MLIKCNGVEWPDGVRRSRGYTITPRPIIHRTSQSPNTGKTTIDYRELVMHDIEISYRELAYSDYLLIYNSLKSVVGLDVEYYDYNDQIMRQSTFYAPQFIRGEPMAAPNTDRVENVYIRLDGTEPVNINA